jgi:outer membrane protein
MRVCLLSICALVLLTNVCWGQFESSSPMVYSLEQSIQLAEKYNAGLIAARQSYNVAKRQVLTGWGNLLPSLDSQIGYSRRITGPTDRISYDPISGELIPGLSGIDVSKYYTASVSASQSWSLGGYNLYQIREIEASKNSARNSYELSRQELILSVKRAYFDVLKSKMLLEIQKDALNRANEQLKIAQTRYDLGAASYSDVLKAKVQYGDVELALISAENTVKVAKATLNNWMGQDVNAPIEVEENLTKPEFEYSYDEALKTAMQDNPSLNKAKFDFQSAQAQFGMSRSGWFPSFSLRGSYSWSNTDLNELKNIRNRDYDWSLSASISFNIFDNFQKNYNLSYAKANRISAGENYSQTKRDVALELKQAYLNVEEAQQTIDLTEEKQASAREDLDLVQEKYNLGSASILELLDAEVSLKQAESDRVQALYDFNLAVAQFEKALGR